MSGPVIEVLKKVSIHYPGKPHSTLLSDLIAGGELINFLKSQYPNVEQKGNVQFIPELRGRSGVLFLEKELLQPADSTIHATNIAGEEQEIKVQDRFALLRHSELLSDHSLVIMHNIKKETIRFNQLKKHWTNEFDLILFDPTFGVFISEIKSRAYANLQKKDVEVKRQESRYKLLSEIREFYGRELPIHTLFICQSYNNFESQIIEEEFKNIQDHDYRIVINLNIEEDISNIWNLTLCYLTSVSMRRPPKGNVTEFAAVLYAIQLLDEITPSAVHCKFIEQGFQNPERNKRKAKGEQKSIIWSREQKEILDYYDEKCLMSMNEGSNDKMRLCISGCFGSGKTMLLIKFAEQFTDKYPGYQILFLVYEISNILLLDTLRNCPQLRGNRNIKVALSTEFMSFNWGGDTLLESCKEYQLILIDEYRILSNDGKLDVSNIKDSHLAFVTSCISTTSATCLPAYQFKNFALSGSLRATKDITEYIKETQLKMQLKYPSFPVNQAHNISYRPVTTNNFDSGKQCVEQCITCITEIFKQDCNESIMVIGSIHRWFLYRLSMRLKDENIPYQFKLHSNSLQYSADSSDNTDNSNVTLCDYVEATGSERSTVIFVCDIGTASLASLAISRATTQAFVYQIDLVFYKEDLPINLVPALSMHTVQDIKIPCFTFAGEKNLKAFIEYVKYFVENGITGQNKVYPDKEKKILVIYSDKDVSMINQIKESLPPELQCVIVFECYLSTSYESLDFSKEFILTIYCFCGGVYHTGLISSTILPHILVDLIT